VKETSYLEHNFDRTIINDKQWSFVAEMLKNELLSYISSSYYMAFY
jgi:hypothetical protein